MNTVYIHIPFCSSICTYCDFAKMLYFEKFVSRYLDALLYEIKTRYKGEEIKKIYIGGGTPSALNIKETKKLFEIIKKFKISTESEFTIECNINDITPEKIKLYKNNGVNRISLGIQTFNKKVLIKMNRNHDYNIVKEKIELLKKNGIKNINVDLIYAFPETTILDLKNDLDLFFSLDVNHISTYSLMIEPHTMLFINKTKKINEELDYDMYNFICKEMENHGFIHYEISNFCLPGYESKHNLTYWNNLEYYGFGLGASGYIGNLRYTNTLSFDKYLEHKFIFEEENLTLKDKKIYELILGFRKINGINIDEFNQKYNDNILDKSLIKKLINDKNLIVKENFIKIPYEKIYIQNEILLEVLDYE